MFIIGAKRWWELEKREEHCSGGPVDKNPPANAGDMGSIPGLGIKIPQCCRVTKAVHHYC